MQNSECKIQNGARVLYGDATPGMGAVNVGIALIGGALIVGHIDP
jgi:hypothetical protein